MTKYREILRLKSLGFSERNIALSIPCSRNTVSKVLKRAKEEGISWPLPDDTTKHLTPKIVILQQLLCIDTLEHSHRPLSVKEIAKTSRRLWRNDRALSEVLYIGLGIVLYDIRIRMTKNSAHCFIGCPIIDHRAGK